MTIPERQTWLITGAAGFIGSHLVEGLLRRKQNVIGVDGFFANKDTNLERIKAAVSPEDWARFEFVKGDINDETLYPKIFKNVDFVLHHAAISNVQASIARPLEGGSANMTIFQKMLLTSMKSRVRRFIYASSCAVYGDTDKVPTREDVPGKPISPYAASKRSDELHADVFSQTYGMHSVGLRYFNVYGPGQNADSQFSPVIPKWIRAFRKREPITIFGDGSSSRDFCHVDDIVQANLQAALWSQPTPGNEIFNIASGHDISLNELFQLIKNEFASLDPSYATVQPVYRDFVRGEIRRSCADISKARTLLGFEPKPAATLKDFIRQQVRG